MMGGEGRRALGPRAKRVELEHSLSLRFRGDVSLGHGERGREEDGQEEEHWGGHDRRSWALEGQSEGEK